jgi:hypothetical protein
VSTVAVGVALPVGVGDAEPSGDCDVPVGVGVAVDVAVAVSVCVALSDGAGDAEPCTDCVPLGVLVGDVGDVSDIEADDDGLAVSLASARFTPSGVSSRPPGPVMPWPSSDTASRLPPVAVAAPASHAATPTKIRDCTSSACRSFS